MEIRILALTSKSPKKTFKFRYSFDNINIKRIDVPSLNSSDINSWYNGLCKLTIVFTFIDRKGQTTSFPLNLGSQVDNNQTLPIVQFTDFIVPEENRGNMTSFGNWISELQIELKSQEAQYDNTEVNITYHGTPGVIENE
jgi:hypothetical protein